MKPESVESLSAFLQEYSVDVSFWGHDGTRPVDALFTELSSGESLLIERDGALVRVCTLVLARIPHSGKPDHHLFVVEQRFRDGQSRRRQHLPGGKIKAEESAQQAIRREVREELGLDVSGENLPQPEVRETSESSPSYPGLHSIYPQMLFNFPPTHGLPTESFQRTDADGSVNVFAWLPHTP